MGIGDFFRNINSKLEEKYYAMSDFLSEKGLPIDRYNDFLENHGIPPMWFNLIILILIVAIVLLILFFSVNSTINMSLSFVDEDQNPLSNITLTLKSGEEVVYNGIVSSENIKFKTKIGNVLTVNVYLEDYYLVGPEEIVISSKELTQIFVLSKDLETGSMTFRLLDNKDNTFVPNADINIFSDDGTLLFSGVSDESGNVNLTDVPLNQPLKVIISKDGYHLYDQISVSGNGLKDLGLEPKEISNGESGTINFNISSNNQPLKDVLITIYNSKTQQKLSEIYTDNEGKALENIPKGTIVRYVVSKTGYITWDSEDYGRNLKLTSDAESININLSIGGTSLKVIVKDETDKELVGVNVALYSDNGLLISTQITNAFGIVDFNGLDVKRSGYVSTAEFGNYFPSVKTITPNTEQLTIVLTKMAPNNIARLQLFTVDIDNKPVQSQVSAYYMEDDVPLPIYLTKTQTSISGALFFNLEANKKILVSAQSEKLYGSDYLDLNAGETNYSLVMTPNEDVSKVYFYDVLGDPLKNAQVQILSGNTKLFDGNTLEGNIEFYPNGSKEVEINVIYDDESYSKIMTVEKEMEVLLNEFERSKNPKISFDGVYDLEGNQLNGVKLGNYYFLKFTVIWPGNQDKGEVHIRVGEDTPIISLPYSINSVISSNSIKEYGLHYNPNSTESNVKDLKVFGRPGIKNKWVNLYFNNPKGLSEIKVKIKLDDAKDLENINIDYRVNSFDGLYHSEPNTEINSNKLLRLYSLTKKETINVFSDLFACNQNLCYSYSYSDSFKKYDSFSAIKNETYALDFDFYALETLNVNIDFNTNNNTNKLLLNNISNDVVNFSPLDLNFNTLNIPLSILKGEHKKYRLYFRTNDVGVGNILMSSKELNMNKEFNFNIENQKPLTVKLNANTFNIGQQIIFDISDSSNKISNAKINLVSSDNAVIQYIEGNNTNNLGLNGKYVINELPSGIYNYKVSATGHNSTSGQFLITRTGVFDVDTEIEIKIPVGMKTRSYEIPFKNISKFNLKNIGLEIMRDDATNFNIDYRISTTNLMSSKTSKIIVNVSYDENDLAYGDQDIALTGIIDGGEIVRQVIHINYVANSNLDASCLAINPSKLPLILYDGVNQKVAGEIQIQNNCEVDISNLNPELVLRSNVNLAEIIDLQIPTTSIKKGDTKLVKYTFSLKSLISSNVNVEAFINFNTEYFQKQLPVTLNLVHSFGDLIISVSPSQLHNITTGQLNSVVLSIFNNGTTNLKNITISAQQYNNYIDQTMTSGNAMGLSNIGNSTVSNFYNPDSFILGNDYPFTNWDGTTQIKKTNVAMKILPRPTNLQILGPQQRMNSIISFGVEGLSFDSAFAEYVLVVKGTSVADNSQIVKYVPLFAQISSSTCVEFYANGTQNILKFKSTKLNINATTSNIVVINNCAESVRLNLPSVKNVSTQNILTLSSNNLVLTPGQRTEIKSVVAVKEKQDDSSVIDVFARGLSTNKTYAKKINYEFKFGDSAVSSSQEPTTKKTIKDCDTSEDTSLLYPKVAKSMDCSNAYCDGKLASEFISQKVNGYVKEYKNKLAVNSKDIKTCAESKCEFGNIGVEDSTFVVYLMEDNLSNEYFNNVLLEKIKTNLKTVNILPNNYSFENMKSTSNYNVLFIEPNFKGCGKYTVTLNGFFNVVDNIAQSDNYSIIVKFEKENTEECKRTVNNAALFLPLDTTILADSAFGFKPAFVYYDTKYTFKPLSDFVSKELFGTERVLDDRDNTLFLTKGDVGKNLIKLKFDNNNVVVVINENFNLEQDKDKKDLVNVIKSALQGNFTGCYNAKNNEFEVVSPSDSTTGQYELKGCNVLNVDYGDIDCTFTISGTKTGYGSFSFYPAQMEGYSAKIIDSIGNEVNDVSFVNASTKEYVLRVNFTDPNKAISYSENLPLKIIFTPTNGEEKQLIVKFKPCGVSPEAYLGGILNSDLSNKNYSALIYWEGEKEGINSCEVLNKLAQNKNISFSGKVSNNYCAANNTKAVVETLNKGLGLRVGVSSGVSAGVCMLAELAFKGKAMSPALWVEAGIECGVIVGSFAGSTLYANHRLNVYAGNSSRNALDKVHDSLNDFILTDWMFEDYEDSADAQKALKDSTDISYLNELEAAATGATVNAGVRGAEVGYTSVKNLANGTYSQNKLADEFIDMFVKKLSDPANKDIINNVTSKNELLKKFYNTDPKFAEVINKHNKQYKSSLDDLIKIIDEKINLTNKDTWDRIGNPKTITTPGTASTPDPSDVKRINEINKELTTKLGPKKGQLTNQIKACMGKTPPCPNLKQLNDDFLKIDTEIKKIQAERDVLKLKIKNLPNTPPATVVDDIDDDALKALIKDVESKTLTRTKIWNFAKGMLRGAVAGVLADLAYKGTSKLMTKESFNSAKSIEFILPDNFVRNHYYTMILTVDPNNENKYIGTVKELESNKILQNFCNTENITKGYISDGLIDNSGANTLAPIPTSTSSSNSTNATQPLIGCTHYKDLFIKYGDILKQKTNGKMDAKNLIAQTYKESRFNPMIVSQSYAVGLGQLKPETFCDLTKNIIKGKYSEFSSVFNFNSDDFKELNIKNFNELYDLTCNTGKMYQKEGGLLYDGKGILNKDPRTKAELSIMYQASLLYSIYTNKKDLELTVKSYVVGPGCVDSSGNIPDTNKCKGNQSKNQSIDLYWTEYLNYLNNESEKCLSYSALPKPITTKLGPELSKNLISIDSVMPLQTNYIKVNTKYFDDKRIAKNTTKRAAYGFVVLHDGGWEKSTYTDDVAVNNCIHDWDARKTSSHYYIGCSGEIFKLVSEDYGANHAGCKTNDKSCKDILINTLSIAIDLRHCINFGGYPYTLKQHESLKKLLKDIKDRGLIKDISDTAVIAHFELAAKGDPRSGFDWGYIGLSDHRTLKNNSPFILAYNNDLKSTGLS